jgi:hypothetical protein
MLLIDAAIGLGFCWLCVILLNQVKMQPSPFHDHWPPRTIKNDFSFFMT